MDNKEKESIKNAIQYLDSFHRDLGQFFSSFESLLAELGFLVHPEQGNKTSFIYQLSNNITWYNTWTLKNIQRYYLNSADIEKDKINSVLFCSLSLYDESIFTVPVLICGKIQYHQEVTAKKAWDFWLWDEIVKIDSNKSPWRFKTLPNKNSLIYNLRSISTNKLGDKITEKKDIIDSIKIIFVDLLSMQNHEKVKQIVDPMVGLYNDDESILIKKELVISPLPEKLIDCWSK